MIQSARPAWSIQDFQVSALELLSIQGGEPRPRDLHPLTEQRLQSRGDWTHLDLVRDIISASWGDGQARHLDDRQLMAQGLGTAALADLYSSNSNRRVLTRLPKLLSKVGAFCANVEIKNYLPAETGFFALDVGISDASDRIREWQTIAARAASEAVQLVSSPIRLRFSEQLIVDDNIGAVNAIVDAVIMAAHQNELRASFGLLTSNPTLKDGPLFGADNSAATLALGVQALRDQSLNGQATDADAFCLLVPSADEDAARQAVAARYVGGDPWVKLVPTAYLPDGTWYLCADPAMFPCIVRGTMRGSEGQSLRFSPGNPTTKEGGRDAILEGQHTFSYAAVSRIGLVKVAVA